MLIACFYLPDIGIAVEHARVPFHRDSPLALAELDGVISTVSPLARKGGVQEGMTITGARALCRELFVLPYNRTAYEEAAEAAWREDSRRYPASAAILVELPVQRDRSKAAAAGGRRR